MKKITVLIFLLFFRVCLLSQEVDSKAPDFTAQDLGGNTIKLSELTGKVVILDFWASWCAPCKKSIPHMVELFEKNKDSSFLIIGINVDEEKSKIKEFQDFNGIEINFPVIYDKDSKLPGIYKAEGMPTTVIIDKQGIIRYKEIGFSNDVMEKIDLTVKKLSQEK